MSTPRKHLVNRAEKLFEQLKSGKAFLRDLVEWLAPKIKGSPDDDLPPYIQAIRDLAPDEAIPVVLIHLEENHELVIEDITYWCKAFTVRERICDLPDFVAIFAPMWKLNDTAWLALFERMFESAQAAEADAEPAEPAAEAAEADAELAEADAEPDQKKLKSE